MSLSRSFFNELRPLFRVLEDPFFHHPAVLFNGGRSVAARHLFAWNRTNMTRPAVDLHESDHEYIVEAELPGVKKDNVEVRVGDNGQSITIEGKVDMRSAREQAPGLAAATETAETQTATDAAAHSSQQPNLRELSSERQFVGSSVFTRTVWLPRRVESANVTAKMEDGVLTVKIPKLQSEPDAVKVPIA